MCCSANWVELRDCETGSKYFYNQITHRSQFDKPVQPQKACLLSLFLKCNQIMHALLLWQTQMNFASHSRGAVAWKRQVILT